ncbi:MAG: DUF3500 domain-containing protein [Planctomycetia bacterium]|nr:DUF3500 domain-containing protein [Planctomycetia bacterium]
MMRDRRRWVVACLVVLALATTALAPRAAMQATVVLPLAEAATEWVETLDAGQRARAMRPFDDASRTDWHFVPKPQRKGVQLRDMTAAQERAALALLRASLSEAGYDKARDIMSLDGVLRIIEGSRAKNIRDPKRYFFTIYGTPAEGGTWALSIEGHHLSFNIVVRDGVVVDSTPQFLGANPAEVKTTFAGLPEAGHRVLGDEEALAFDLVRSLDAAQRDQAVLAAEAPREIRAAGEPQPALDPPAGIAHADLEPAQRDVLRELVETYACTMPEDVAAERLRLIESGAGGWDAVRFAWLGPLEPGIGHAYRIEGPSFSVEFVNNQPDAEGNPANHVHCVWRDRTGDFDLPVPAP